MRHALGLAVFAGMLGVTLFGVFLTPVFFAVIQGWWGDRRGAPPRHAPASANGPPLTRPVAEKELH